MSIRLVCFDLGGVIVRICRSFVEGCAAAGLPARAPRETIDASREDRRRLSDLHQVGHLPCDHYFDAVSRAMGGLYSPDEVRRIHRAWLLGEYSGVGALVEDLHRSGPIRTGILSNTNHDHWREMLQTPRFSTPGLIQHRHASHLLGHAKPGMEIYHAFERAVELPGAAILFFDDLPENVEAARTAGWHAHRVDPDADTAAQMRGHLRGLGLL